jgi:hypothetical protein
LRSLRGVTAKYLCLWAEPVPANPVDPPAHWHDLAQKMRALADRMHDPMSKQMMHMIADDYDRLAGELEKRARGKPRSG